MTYRFSYFVSSPDSPNKRKFYETENDSYQDAVTLFSNIIRHTDDFVVDFSPNYVVIASSGDKSFRKFKERGIFLNFVR